MDDLITSFLHQTEQGPTSQRLRRSFDGEYMEITFGIDGEHGDDFSLMGLAIVFESEMIGQFGGFELLSPN